MKRMLPLIIALMLVLTPIAGRAAQDEDVGDDSQVYTMVDESGVEITAHAGQMFVDDEYISGDNQLYRVVSVDDAAKQAVARHMGAEPAVDRAAVAAVIALAEATKNPDNQSDQKKLIAMYSTHSDESYEEGDGTASKREGAGIYDVGDALKENLEKLGITVELDKTTHHPHDAKAYSRSRRTAEELLKSQPDALLDIHRDAIPVEQYETDVQGEETSKVRLLVGRSNPSSQANREFAKEIKATADKEYPGLVKDIFIGKGNYNQELYPRAILLEFGTHVIEKEKAISSTEYMAQVINDVLYGETAKAAPAGEGEQTPAKQEDNKAGASGIIWLIVIAALAAATYALISTGTFKRMGEKLGRGASEVTGGAIGKKPKDR